MIRLRPGHLTGRNNREIRYLDRGPLRGAIVTAEPTAAAPFGYRSDAETPGILRRRADPLGVPPAGIGGWA